MNASPDVREKLSRLLADTYALSLKTQNYHWNVTGPAFPALHGLFGDQYEELAEAVDALAERLRALGARAPGSFREFGALAAVKDAAGGEDADAMLAALAEGHETAAHGAQALVTAAGEGDPATADLATVRIAAHQKAAWMLRSSRASK